MDEERERALVLYRSGVWTEAIGPEQEWSPVGIVLFQARHNQFWSLVEGMIRAEPGDYDDLPEWMTESATAQLENQN